MHRSQLALTASLVAGLSTGLGALPVLFVRRLSPRMTAALLGSDGRFSGSDTGTGQIISAGIVIQNLPEGLIAAISLVAASISRRGENHFLG